MTIYKGSSEGNFVLRAVEGGFDAPGRSGFEAAGRIVMRMGRCFSG